MNFSEYRRSTAQDRHNALISVPREARELQGQRAGFVTRLLAVVIDIALVIVFLALVHGFIALINLILDRVSDFALPELAADFAFGLVLLWLIWTVGWWSAGRSFGNYVMGLRIVDHRGDNPALPLAALRAVFCIGFPVGLIWTLVSRQNRSVQDIVLRTNVINDWVMGLPSLSRRSRYSDR